MVTIEKLSSKNCNFTKIIIIIIFACNYTIALSDFTDKQHEVACFFSEQKVYLKS